MKLKPGFVNTGMIVDQVHQREGFDLYPHHQDTYCLFFKKMIYEFTLHDKWPLMFIHPDGRIFQPDRHFLTDMGSVPRILQGVVPKDRFIGFYLHDSAYRFKGLWVSNNGGMSFRFEEMLRVEVDELLRIMIKYDPVPGNVVLQYGVLAGVRIGGWYGWGRGDERKPTPTNKIDDTKPPIAFA